LKQTTIPKNVTQLEPPLKAAASAELNNIQLGWDLAVSHNIYPLCPTNPTSTQATYHITKQPTNNQPIMYELTKPIDIW